MKGIYKISDTVRLSLHSLRVHVVRSMLTVLGILFGVWSVIAMLAITEGTAQQSQAELQKLGSDNLIIESIPSSDATAKASDASAGALVYGLTKSDVLRMRTNIPGIVRCIAVHRAAKDVAALGGIVKARASILGTEPAYLQSARLELEGSRSRFISDADILRCNNYCVITADLARKLYAYEDPIGQELRIELDAFVVIGVIKRGANFKTSSSGPQSGGQVLIPLSTDRQRFGEYSVQRSQGSYSLEKVDVHQLILQMADDKAVLGGAKIARALLARYHDATDYDITVPLELIEQREAQSRLWNIVFFVIASVSLLVGGIGIMNIMLASVTERTREIGIRRALGAKKRDIITQFLVEAITLTVLGGVLGIVIGAVVVPWGVYQLLGLEAVVRGVTLFIPFGTALAVGLGSGLYPAMRAANLDPIVALRHE